MERMRHLTQEVTALQIVTFRHARVTSTAKIDRLVRTRKIVMALNYSPSLIPFVAPIFWAYIPILRTNDASGDTAIVPLYIYRGERILSSYIYGLSPQSVR